MFFNRNKYDVTSDLTNNEFPNSYDYTEEDEYEEPSMETEKKRAFYRALHGKSMEQIMGELSAWVSKRILQRTAISNSRINDLEQQISGLKADIREKKEKLQNTESTEERYSKEISEIQFKIGSLNRDFKIHIKQLGDAHNGLIEKRIEKAQNELSKLITMYQELFEQKYGSEEEFGNALKKRRGLVDSLITDATEKLKVTQEYLTELFRFGGSKMSSIFITSAGFLAAIAAGWFFSVFSSSNEFEGQNWLFFGLTNLFNYLFLYVEQFGPLDAFKGMFMNFIGLLVVVSVIIWIAQYALHQLTNDESNIEFGFNYSKPTKNFLKLKIRTKSALSFWLQLLPWIFVAGIIIIVLTIGQYIGTEEDQIGELGKRLSGQIVGTVIALICTAIFYLYVARIIEPRRSKKNNDESKETNGKRNNIELFYLIIGINVLIVFIVINQVIGSTVPFTRLFFSVLCFTLLLNLTAFTLSYGLRQRGLFLTQNELESKIKYLTNLRTSLSGSTPVGLWIREDNQFQKGFLAIQKDIIDLSRQQNRALTNLQNPRKTILLRKKIDPITQMSAERFGEMSKSTKRESQFFLLNFPDLSFNIAKLRNELNEAKRDLDAAQTRLRDLRDGHSDFQNTLKDEIRNHKGQVTHLQRSKIEIQENTHRSINKLEEERKAFELYLMEGFELGTWTKDTLLTASIKDLTA